MEGLSQNRAEWDRALNLCEIVESERPYRGPGLELLQGDTFMVTDGSSSPAYSEFHEALYSLGIVSPENSPGRDFQIKENLDIDRLSTKALAQLITAVCRRDRFSEGLLTHYINNGVVTNAFRRLRELHLREIGEVE